jgi:hypothetical protein
MSFAEDARYLQKQLYATAKRAADRKSDRDEIEAALREAHETGRREGTRSMQLAVQLIEKYGRRFVARYLDSEHRSKSARHRRRGTPGSVQHEAEALLVAFERSQLFDRADREDDDVATG